jgi:hypothetical protein
LNDKRLAVGILAWFLGIVVPVYHHVGLHAAIAHGPSSNDITRIRDVWDWLPWVDWVYLALMFVVGAILIGSELGNGPLRRSRNRARAMPAARGFEVITTPPPGEKGTTT